MAAELPDPAPKTTVFPALKPEAGAGGKTPELAHPAGRAKHGTLMQIVRGFTWAAYFVCCCVAIGTTQFLGAPLYYIRRDLYYAYMALTKQSFALLTTTMTQWWGPTKIRISGDASVAHQMRQQPDGMVEFDFPERLVLVANHQIYTDWLYLWWIGYANTPRMHGHIYIILKESLKWIPFIGWGMMFYGFIFMSRKMATDRPRLAHRLGQLKTTQRAPDGTSFLSPMWLLLFPEGTNLALNGRTKSAAWAEKMGLRDGEHVLLPRSTGMYFCLKELGDTVDYVYDCTVAYEGIPRGKFGQDYFTLSSTYFQGRPPRSVNFHWRRFKVSDIPLETADAFELWLRARWYEKDALMEQYLSTGRFPPLVGHKQDYIESEIRTKNWWDFSQIFVVFAAFSLLCRIFVLQWVRFTGA
ncbi:putative acyltransferase like protein [Verticillium longisporum]|nr:putative acyltransferase like protein [Verticillium longisporum]